MPDYRTDPCLVDDQSRIAVASAGDLPTEHARNGRPTLSLAGLRLHSSVNPEAEADALFASLAAGLERELALAGTAPVMCVLFGPGLGYLVAALSRWAVESGAAERLRVLCVETEPAVARKALQLRVWEPSGLAVQWLIAGEKGDALRPLLSGTRAFAVRSTPGYRLHRERYDRLWLHVERGDTTGRPMRILVPTPLYGGSLPIAFHSADAFRKLGHHVEVLDLSPFYGLYTQAETVTHDPRHRRALQGLLTAHLAETIVARALDWNADLVWAVAQTPLVPPALQELRHEGIHTALWFVEDFNVFTYWRELAPHFDAVFTIQREPFHSELRRLGVPHVAYLPCAANPDVHRPLSLTAEERERYGSEVSFVGAGYYNRQMLFANLPLRDFKIWGSDWPAQCAAADRVQEGGRRVSTEETAKIYCASRINLNLHSSPVHTGVNPTGDFVNPRTFEIAACGGFQVVDARSELSDLFDNTELVVFRRAEELPSLVEHCLADEDARRAVAERSRGRVLAEHTYVHRMQAALNFLEERLPKLAQRKHGPNYLASLKAAAAGDPELLEFLAAFDGREEVDLDGIVSRIKVGEGALTRPEGLFLLMKEFRDWGREKGVIA